MTTRHLNKLRTFFKGCKLPVFSASLLTLSIAISACGQPVAPDVLPQETKQRKQKLSDREKCIQKNRENRCEVTMGRCGSKLREGDDVYCYQGTEQYALQCVYWDFDTTQRQGEGIKANDGNDPERDEYIAQGYCVTPCTAVKSKCGFLLEDKERPTAPKIYLTEIFDSAHYKCVLDDPNVPVDEQQGHCQYQRPSATP